MGLEAQQRLLSRLYVDAALRARFRDDARGLAVAEGLAPEEAARLADPALVDQVEGFARSLVAKRAGEVADLLPLTRRALGAKYRSAFAAFAAGFVPRGVKKHRDDALAFAVHLATPPAELGAPPWLPDLARWEAAWLEAADPARWWVVRFFRRPMRALALAVEEGEDPGVLPRGWAILLSWRAGPRSRGRVVTLGG